MQGNFYPDGLARDDCFSPGVLDGGEIRAVESSGHRGEVQLVADTAEHVSNQVPGVITGGRGPTVGARPGLIPAAHLFDQHLHPRGSGRRSAREREPAAGGSRPKGMRSFVLGALVLVLAACGESPAGDGDVASPGPGAVTEQKEYQEPAPEHENPPDVVIRAGDDVVAELSPFSASWTTSQGNGRARLHADGVPPHPLPDVGAHPELVVEFPEDGWDFTAGFSRVDDPCARNPIIELERLSPTTFALPSAGEAGTYEVSLSGKRDSSRVSTKFRWTTTTEGKLPPPEAWLAIISGDHDTIESYGTTLSITGLAESSGQASATINVTAAGGESITFEAEPIHHGPEGCASREGELMWSAPADRGLEAAQVGDAPFTYTVDLVLDGRAYQGTGTWPDDVIENKGPAVAMTFEPPLPSATP